MGLAVAALATLSEFFSIPYTPIWSIVMIIVYVAIMAAFIKAAPGSEEELEMEQAAVMAPPPVVEEAPVMAAAPAVVAVAAPAVAAAVVAPPRSLSPSGSGRGPGCGRSSPPIAGAPGRAGSNETYDLTDIEGIGPAYAEKLDALGLKTTDDLLQARGHSERPGRPGGKHGHQRPS